MFISVFDMFKIGIGPSSSHTMGPMVAANYFLNHLKMLELGEQPLFIKATLYGSLAFTGKGHATDKAVILGLAGFELETLDPSMVDEAIAEITKSKLLKIEGLPPLSFDPNKDIIFDYSDPLPAHPNGLIFSLYNPSGILITDRIYYSVGGGFVLEAAELEAQQQNHSLEMHSEKSSYPHAFKNAKEMLEMGEKSELTIAQMKLDNEIKQHSEKELYRKLDQIWQVMNDCIDRGMHKEGILPGGLEVKRRAPDIYQQLKEESKNDQIGSFSANEWLSLYAMAVNEENAAGGQVVTAPTNGAAGVIPAVLRYYFDHITAADPKAHRIFLLTAAAIGGVIKSNASISGAEVGCQGEVGSAAAMAAAGFCAVMGGTNEQIENAAEIALEHHLGMTCDPVKGLVQVPCIERNGLGAVKAVTAAMMALRGDGKHFMPLDNCIETMRQTGLDMSEKYKETSLGGLAVNYPQC